MATKAKWKMPDGEGGFYVIHHATAAEMVKYGSTTVKSFLDNLPVMNASTFMKTLLTKTDAEAVRSYLKVGRETIFDESGWRWSNSTGRLVETRSKFGTGSWYNANGYLNKRSVTLGGGNFAVSCWCWTSSSSTSTQTFFSWGDSSTRFYVSRNSSNKIYCGYTYSGTVQIGSGTNTLPSCPSSDWFHLEIDYRNSDQTLFAFVNGEMILSSSSTTGLTSASTKSFYIGANASDTSNAFSGYIDEFLITNRTLHTSNFTPPTAPYTYNSTYDLALLHFE